MLVIHGTPLYALILVQGITQPMRSMGVYIQRQLLPTACFTSGLSRLSLSSLSLFRLPPPSPSCYYFPCLATCTHLPNRTIINAHKQNARRRRGTNIVVAHKANNNAVNDDVNADDDEDDDVANNDADDDHNNDDADG